MSNRGGVPNSATGARMAQAGDGLHIDEATIATLHEATGGVFTGTDEWTPESGALALDRAELAAFAGGGVGTGAAVTARSVFGFGLRDLNTVELETIGPRDNYQQYVTIEPYETSRGGVSGTLEDANGDLYEPTVTLDNLSWGDHNEHAAAGLAAFARTAHTAENCGIETIYLGADTQPLWQALGYDENPGELNVSTYISDDISALRDALAEYHAPDPWGNRS